MDKIKPISVKDISFDDTNELLKDIKLIIDRYAKLEKIKEKMIMFK
ncbi:MAG: hypothetical protein ACOC3V_02570 [bacterium]